MTKDDLEKLRRSIDEVVTLVCTDGEIITAKVDLVCDEDEEIIYQMLATNREKRPAYAKAGIGGEYLIRFDNVERLEVKGANSLRG